MLLLLLMMMMMMKRSVVPVHGERASLGCGTRCAREIVLDDTLFQSRVAFSGPNSLTGTAWEGSKLGHRDHGTEDGNNEAQAGSVRENNRSGLSGHRNLVPTLWRERQLFGQSCSSMLAQRGFAAQ